MAAGRHYDTTGGFDVGVCNLGVTGLLTGTRSSCSIGLRRLLWQLLRGGFNGNTDDVCSCDSPLERCNSVSSSFWPRFVSHFHLRRLMLYSNFVFFF